MVKSANDGEQWNAGTINTISWMALGPVGPVKVVLRKGDVRVQVLSPNEAPSMQGTFKWNIPWNKPPGDEHKIRVRTIGQDNVIRDDSGPFSIVKDQFMPGPPQHEAQGPEASCKTTGPTTRICDGNGPGMWCPVPADLRTGPERNGIPSAPQAEKSCA